MPRPSRRGSFMRRLSFAIVFFCLVAPTRADIPEKPDVDKLNKKIDDFSLKTGDGKTWPLSDLKGKKAVVVVFLSFDCPVSNSYAPTLAALHKSYSDRGVSFVAVNASDDLTAAELAKQAGEFKLPFPVLKDDAFKVADLFKAKVVPEAFVPDHNHPPRSRGGINNSSPARLRRNAQTTEHDLKDAIEALLAGKSPKVPATRAIGCPITR